MKFDFFKHGQDTFYDPYFYLDLEMVEGVA